MDDPTPPGSPPPGPPPPGPPAARHPGDVAASVVAMILTVLTVGFGATVGLFSLAFLDHCPPATCSVDGAVTAVMTAVGAAGVVGIAGIITTIVRLTARKSALPFALGTLLLCIAVLLAGAMAYTAAVS